MIHPRRALSLLAAWLLAGAGMAHPPPGFHVDAHMRDTGYVLGDRLQQHIDIVAPKGARLDPASLPNLGLVTPWLELQARHVETRRDGVRLTFDYQVFGAVESAQALAVPAFVTHQGRLFDASGMPVSGTQDLTFAIYDAENGGNEIWSEIITVDFDEGFFSVRLGEQLPLDEVVFDGSTRWLGITVGADPEMTPRAAIVSVPYAMFAGDVRGEINPTNVVATDGEHHPEEFQTKFHEAQWRQMKARPWLFVKTVFAMFDFASDGRSEGDKGGINDKGMVTYDRLIKKDAFYFYKANWTNTPFAYITSRRFCILPSSTYFFSRAGAWTSDTSASPRAARARACPVPTEIVFTE